MTAPRKPREFWITTNTDGSPTHIALFEYCADKNPIHVREVMPQAEGEPQETNESSIEKLDKVLDELGMQVTFSGWRVELEKSETENEALRTRVAELEKAVSEAKDVIKAYSRVFEYSIVNIQKEFMTEEKE